MKLSLKIFIVFALVHQLVSAQENNDLKLWYKQPATQWTEALPLGNGHIGAMIFGGVDEELIQLNESTLWSGGPVKKSINPDAFQYLSKVRDALLKDEDYTKANILTKNMQGYFTQSYLPLCDVVIKQNFNGAKPSKFYRDLNISKAIATTWFTVNGVEYKREIFASYPSNVIVVKITSSQKGKLNFTVSTTSQLHFSISEKNNNELIVNGKAPAYVDPSYYNKPNRIPVIYDDTTGCNGMRFQYRIKAVPKDGVANADTAGIHISNASEVILYFVAATSFNGFDKCPDSQGKNEKHIADSVLQNALKINYAALFAKHIADYQKYFNRVGLHLKDTLKDNPQLHLPTDERLQGYAKGKYDPAMEILYFQYGRYLLIASSRPDGPPANLQGIWNKELRAPWSSNYTININTEMNYWHSEVTNLPEMHLALLNWIKGLSVKGSDIAKEFYHADGWVAHHNSDIWCAANPVGDKGDGDPVWANWAMGGNWLCRQLWEHYLFTKDKKFLSGYAYPVMKKATLFTLDWLTEDKNGFLVTAPATSPENKFRDSTGKEQAVSVATTMDMEIVWDLLSNMIAATEELNVDAGFRKLLIEKRNKLYPLHIGKKGQLLEWYKEFIETDPQHRHVSHLFGLYPGYEITKSNSPFFDAAKKTLEIRGDGGTGWSKGWKINWWARLQDGNHAYKLIRELLKYVNTSEVEMHNSGGTYPNLFDAHPPFQIDGNFAGTAGMAEMLVQSHESQIHLLPALPDAWSTGSVKGLVARGAFVIDMDWRNGKVKKTTIFSKAGGVCVLRCSGKLETKDTKLKVEKEGDDYIYKFNTEKEKKYGFVNSDMR